MSDNKTINYYNENAEAFFQDTACADMSHLYKRFLPLIPAGGRILDLGCGSGRDSRYFIEQGFLVTAVDGSAELCRLASRYIDQEVLCMDFQDLAFENCFDGVWACASLLHVPRDSIKDILARIHRALVRGGVLYASSIRKRPAQPWQAPWICFRKGWEKITGKFYRSCLRTEALSLKSMTYSR